MNMGWFGNNEGRIYSKGTVVTWEVANTPQGVFTETGQITGVNNNSYYVKDNQGNTHLVMHKSIMS
jgi:hypothetical protein